MTNFLKINRDINLYVDFNINHLNLNSYDQISNFIDIAFSFGLFSLITKPTKITSHSTTLINKIFKNIYDFAHTSGFIVCDIGDHFQVFTCRKAITFTCKHIFMISCCKVRNHSKVNMIKLYEKIKI